MCIILLSAKLGPGLVSRLLAVEESAANEIAARLRHWMHTVSYPASPCKSKSLTINSFDMHVAIYTNISSDWGPAIALIKSKHYYQFRAIAA